MEAVLRQLGSNVSRQRAEAGLTQEQLAHRADLDRTLISSVELGKKLVRIDTLIKLSRGLQLPLAELLEGIV